MSIIPSMLKADKKWNATGTTLTTSDDEGVIRIYKRESAVGCAKRADV